MFNASFASAVIIMTFIIVRGFQALALFYVTPTLNPSPRGRDLLSPCWTLCRPAGLYVRCFASAVVCETI